MAKCITKNLKTRQVRAEMVPKNLNGEQTLKRTEICVHILQNIKDYPDFLSSVVSCDKFWLFQERKGSQQECQNSKLRQCSPVS
jgi:hypothetical protein